MKSKHGNILREGKKKMMMMMMLRGGKNERITIMKEIISF